MEESNLTKTSLKSPKMATFSFAGAMEALLSVFPKRSQEIVAERYGLGGESEKTLEEIGDQFHVTRERVRQIIREVLKKIKEKSKSPLLEDAQRRIMLAVQEKNGIMKEVDLIEALSKGNKKEAGAVRFFVDLSDELKVEKIPGEILKSLMLDSFKIAQWRAIKNKVKEVLEKEKVLLGDQELISKVEKVESVDSQKLFDFMAVSEEVKKNQFGKWGLSISEEVTPKGTREKAYLVLKESKKPLHFREISSLIDKFGLNKRKTNPQTVHNELIKDSRFILVGRGIYALKEWGYQEGTVKDILENILKDQSAPMNKEEILKKVLKMRQVKKSTVVINLNNFFARVGRDGYTIKK